MEIISNELYGAGCIFGKAMVFMWEQFNFAVKVYTLIAKAVGVGNDSILNSMQHKSRPLILGGGFPKHRPSLLAALVPYWQ